MLLHMSLLQVFFCFMTALCSGSWKIAGNERLEKNQSMALGLSLSAKMQNQLQQCFSRYCRTADQVQEMLRQKGLGDFGASQAAAYSSMMGQHKE